jgi:branched-chain amino acid transport system substrate-binding protein
VWAQAAEQAGTLELPAMIASLREHRLDTVLGLFEFDDKDDLTMQPSIWWVWRNGTYMPPEEAAAKE